MREKKSTLPIIVFTPYFAAKTPERQAEFDECIKHNLACGAISQLILLIDDDCLPPYNHAKLEIIKIPDRPTYQQWINLSKNYLQPYISVLANTDIYFDETLNQISVPLQNTQTFIALSRYERQGTRIIPHPNPQWSQDVWAFNTASDIHPSIYKLLNISLGVPRCDNKAAYIFAIYGWSIINPHYFINSIHVHETQQRNYDKKSDLTIIGAIAYVYPAKELCQPAQLDIDIWVKNRKAIHQVKLNGSFDSWQAETNIIEGQIQPGINQSCQANRAKMNHSEDKRIDAFAEFENKKQQPALDCNTIQQFITHGECVYHHLQRFRIYRFKQQLLCLDGLNLRAMTVLSLEYYQEIIDKRLSHKLLGIFIPAVIDTHPIVINDRPSSTNDCHFWQYPCATEKQALDNHLAIFPGENIDLENKKINIYLGLPWATYIDKKHYPKEIAGFLKPRTLGLKTFAQANGYSLAVHTVCQQIHWRRFMQHFKNLGITDVHLSHCEKDLNNQFTNYPFIIHSWPLIAVNIENKSRSEGIVVNKPIAEKKYLASFIGAHMPHYRSDVRLKLFDTAEKDGGHDILVDLGDEWHFNKIVYQEQVKQQNILDSDKVKNIHSTRRYNEVLSDSIFSLCPEGAGVNTLRVWESLAIGAIPVIISDDWELPVLNDIDISKCLVTIKRSEISQIFDRLRKIDTQKTVEMANNCVQIYNQIKTMQSFCG